jgi:ABC-type dipeptide/oligopeptide/nickel transport system permease subunit
MNTNTASAQVSAAGITADLPAGRRVSLSLLRSFVTESKGAVGLVLTALFLAGGLAGLVMILVPGLHRLYLNQDLLRPLSGPFGPGHLLGTDGLGRDLLARSLAGMGVSLSISISISVISLVLGVTFGLIAGYFGGPVDTLIRALTDLAWGFPLILLAVVLAGVFGGGALSIIGSVGLLGWAAIARVIRGYALTLRQKDFVMAARICDVPHHRIILRHLLPNIYAPILVFGSYSVASVIIVEAGVSYLGLGIQPPTPSLGVMLADGQNYIYSQPWQILLPSIVLAIGALGFNLLGDAFRDLLDPRLARLPN